MPEFRLGEAGARLVNAKQQTNVRVNELKKKGWTNAEIHEAFKRTRGSGFFDDYPKYNMRDGKMDEQRVTEAMAYIPVDNAPKTPLLDLMKSKHTLENMKFRRGKNGIGFKVSIDAKGQNAVVTKIKKAELRAQGLCSGAIVTQINEMDIMGMDHFAILEKYRNSPDEMTITFAVPGLKHHYAPPDDINKRGHKYTLLLVILAILLAIAGLAQDKLHRTDFSVDNSKYDLEFGIFNYRYTIDGGNQISVAYEEVDGDSKWSSIKRSGSLFLGFSIFSIILYIFLIVLALIFVTRRPKSLILENGQSLRSFFLILTMVCCLTSLTAWSAWLASFQLPESMRILSGDQTFTNLEIPDGTEGETEVSIILNAVAFVFTCGMILTLMNQL